MVIDTEIVSGNSVLQDWRCGEVVVATAQLLLTKSKPRFYKSLNQAQGMSEFRDSWEKVLTPFIGHFSTKTNHHYSLRYHNHHSAKAFSFQSPCCKCIWFVSSMRAN